MATLWGSRRTAVAGPATGSVLFPGPLPQPALPQFDPLRFESNGLINVDAPPAQQGRDQQAADVPLGPFVVTLSPLTRPDGSTIALATGDAQVVTDYAALVKWGRGGVQHVALVDWPVNGGSFVVAGDSLYVSLWAIIPPQALTTAGFRNNGFGMAYGAHATPVRAPQATPAPRRTMSVADIIAGGTSGEVFVPPFARRWRWQTNATPTDGTGALVVHRYQFLFRRFGNTFAQEEYFTNAVNNVWGLVGDRIAYDLPTATQTMVWNNFSNPITSNALVFDLDLGG